MNYIKYLEHKLNYLGGLRNVHQTKKDLDRGKKMYEDSKNLECSNLIKEECIKNDKCFFDNNKCMKK